MRWPTAWKVGIGCCIGAVAVGVFVWWVVVRSAIPSPPASVQPLLPKIVHYLEVTERVPSFGGKVFCGVRYLGETQHASQQVIYVWQACQQYSAVRGRLVPSTGTSGPVAVSVEKRAGASPSFSDRQPEPSNEPFYNQTFPARIRREMEALDGSNSTNRGMPLAMFRTDRERAKRVLLR